VNQQHDPDVLNFYSSASENQVLSEKNDVFEVWHKFGAILRYGDVANGS